MHYDSVKNLEQHKNHLFGFIYSKPRAEGEGLGEISQYVRITGWFVKVNQTVTGTRGRIIPTGQIIQS